MGLVVLVTVDGAVLRAPESFVMDYIFTISCFVCSCNKPLSNLCISKLQPLSHSFSTESSSMYFLNEVVL